MELPKKIGFLGGTFDPFHSGHLNVALEMKEKAGLDEVWICPAFVSPFKEETPPVDIRHRMKMAMLGTEGIPGLRVIDEEASSRGPSYTYSTICRLSDRYPNTRLFVIISDDLLPALDRWYNIHKLIEKVPFLIATRSRPDLSDFEKISPLFELMDHRIFRTRIIETGGAEIRERFKNNLCCAHLLPAKVPDYICRHQLY